MLVIVRRTGFLGRCVVVDSEGSDSRYDLIEPPPKFNALRAWLYKDIHRIASLQGQFTWSEEGADWYRAWYREHFLRPRALMAIQDQDGQDASTSTC